MAGAGEPLLLLHGTGGHCEAYSRNLAPVSVGDTVGILLTHENASPSAGKPRNTDRTNVLLYT